MPFNNAVNANGTGVQCLTSGGVWNGRTITAGAGISVTNGDGVAGNPTIAATGAAINPFSTMYLWDDFLYTNDANVNVGDTNWTLNNGTVIAGTATHPGIVKFGDQGGNGFLCKNTSQTTLGSIVLGNGILTIEYVVMVEALTASTSIVGMGIGNLAAEPTSGIYFLYASGTNSGQWVGKTANASSRSSANSANAVVAGQWDRLKIVVNAAATSVSFFVNGTEITNSPLAANIPTQSIDLRCIFLDNSASVQSLNVDLCVISYALTVPR